MHGKQFLITISIIIKTKFLLGYSKGVNLTKIGAPDLYNHIINNASNDYSSIILNLILIFRIGELINGLDEDT